MKITFFKAGANGAIANTGTFKPGSIVAVVETDATEPSQVQTSGVQNPSKRAEGVVTHANIVQILTPAKDEAKSDAFAVVPPPDAPKAPAPSA